MFCTGCGKEFGEQDRFCSSCGKPASGESPQAGPRPRLTRSMREKKIAGVCAGIARHLDWDVTLIRIAFLAAILINGVGLLAYLIGWIAMPRDDEFEGVGQQA